MVVYDRLSVASLLDLAPDSAERINVGKSAGHATMAQADIDRLLVAEGRAGREVVRLKGGDPFVFARGGEEAAALLAAGVPFEVVPGISSAIAVPAYAGIPVTMRHSSTSFTVITGHEDPAKGGELDWDAVARLGGTIVILMGVGRLPKIVRRLLDGGLDPDTPAAAIRWGTRPEQHTVRATLATLTDHELASPATIVIGRVAGLDLRWFESRPLFGKRVVVTRARAQASELAAQLRRLGAEPVELPVIAVDDPADGGARPGRRRRPGLELRLGGGDVTQWGAAGSWPRCATAATSPGCRSPPSARGPPTALRRGQHPCRPRPRAVRGRGAAGRLPRRSRRTADGCCCPGPRWPGTCCPTDCGPPGGRWTWSRPTGRWRCR